MKFAPALLLMLLLAAFIQVPAQYYYRDIISVQQSLQEKKAWKSQQVRSVIVHSFEADGTSSEGFSCQKDISKDYTQIETYTNSALTGKSWQLSFYTAEGLLERAVDSSEISVANTYYTYDSAGKLMNVTSITHAAEEDVTASVKEVHRYHYDANGLPDKMVRIKNDRDSSIVDFIADTKGNITDEIETGRNGKHYYYYYNAKNQLTDIVQFNVVKNALRPNVVFEYDEDGNLVQMTSIEDGAATDYYTWKYVYNEGLRIIEKCFSRDKKLLGYFEYEYKE